MLPTLVPTLSRRNLIRVGMTTLAGYHLLPVLRPLNVQAKAKVAPRKTAEYCIFLFLNGGSPQLDTWDLKEGPWTPPDFDVRTLNGVKWPYGQFSGMAKLLDRVALVRSMGAWESAHARAQYYMQVGHIFSPPRVDEIPAVGAVVAYETLSERKQSDYLPPFVAINFVNNQAGLVKQGCLPDSCSPLTVHTQQQTPFVVPPDEKRTFERRWEFFSALRQAGRTVSSPAFDEFESYYETAHQMMMTQGLSKVLTLQEQDRKRYGESAFGDGCLLARQMVQADAGTRYLLVSQNGWDLHANMYDVNKKVNHYTLCRDFDQAFCALFDDLENTKDSQGKSLLAKTLIVCVGEFGRTGGDLTVNKGRDHNAGAMTGLFAGGGIKGGQVFGITDVKGEKVVKAEWQHERLIYPEDLIATIYSTLGIDWTKKITNTPSGRGFEYIEQQSGTDFVNFGEVSRLFDA